MVNRGEKGGKSQRFKIPKFWFFQKNFFFEIHQTEFLDNEITRLNEKVRKYGLIADNDVIPNFKIFGIFGNFTKMEENRMARG